MNYLNFRLQTSKIGLIIILSNQSSESESGVRFANRNRISPQTAFTSLISSHLTSFHLNRVHCESTKFVVAATNQK